MKMLKLRALQGRDQRVVATRHGIQLAQGAVCIPASSKETASRGFPTLGVPNWGPYYKGILLFENLYWGSPIFVNPPKVPPDLRS